jgi:hypothetical protein
VPRAAFPTVIASARCPGAAGLRRRISRPRPERALRLA